jgi:Flp pilus assembly pilin Flp
MDKLRSAAADVAERAARAQRTLLPWVAPPSRTGPGDGQRGQGLAEYALILAGIAIVAIASLVFLGGTISDLFWAPINEDFGQILSRLGI